MGIYDRDYYQADELRPLRPWDNSSMVTTLIIANVAVFVATLFTSRSGALVDFLGLQNDTLLRPLQWYRLITYGFTHEAALHILGNLVSLYFLGRQVEDKYGKWEFLRVYLLSTVLCGVGWCLLHMNAPSPPVIGASGGVTTVAMLFVFSFPMATLMLYGVIPIKAWVLGILLIVMNMFGGNRQVAYDIHLIGAAFAAVYFYGKLDFGFVERVYSSTRTKLMSKRRGLKVHRPTDSVETFQDQDEQEADRILEKIHRTGKDSLTKREQTFLENYSRKVREQRR